MKTGILPMALAAVAGLALLAGFAPGAAGQNPPISIAPPAAPPPVTETARPSPATPVQLAPDVAEVLKLAQAKIGDETIVAFIESSKKTYDLNANEIVSLRQQGVSDRVLTAMLQQHPRVTQTWAASTPPQPATSAPSAPAPAAAQPSTTTTYVQAPPTYVSPPPVYAYPAPAYPYYGSYPYWGFPLGLSFGFAFGHDSHHGGGYHGGYHGGHH